MRPQFKINAPKRRSCVAALLIGAIVSLSGATAHADAADQARRLHHFDVVKAHGVFESMGVVDGTPQLVLGNWQAETDIDSLAEFCRVIFDYYAELDSAYTSMQVIDGATGQVFATVDASGFHQS